VFTLINQLKQCFNEPYRDIYQLREVQIDRCLAITSGRFTAPVMDNALNTLRHDRLDRFVDFIDGTRLVGLIDKHLPEFWREDERDSLLKSRNNLLDNLSKVIHQLIPEGEKRTRALSMLSDPRFQIEFNYFEGISRYIVDVGYQKLELNEMDPYYTDLPLERRDSRIRDTLAALRKAAKHILYEMDEVAEILKKVVTEKDPIKVYELTEDLSYHVANRAFRFNADEVTDGSDLYFASKDYRERKELLEAKHLSSFYKDVAMRFLSTAHTALISFFRLHSRDERNSWLRVRIDFDITEKSIAGVAPSVVELPDDYGKKTDKAFPTVCCAEAEVGKSITITLAPNRIGFFREETLSGELKADALLHYFQTELVNEFFAMIGWPHEND
jgi:hypothetical protein